MASVSIDLYFMGNAEEHLTITKMFSDQNFLLHLCE
jgi:hypothetical protein